MHPTFNLLVALVLTALPAAGRVEVLPLAEVRVGMVGTGVTVFTGGKLEDFEVEILGVLENSSPRRSTIMARLTGGPLAESGVIAGMSGSPVYIDGKLVGAVSSGFLFSKEPIAGITPIEEMYAISGKDWATLDGPSPRASLSITRERMARIEHRNSVSLLTQLLARSQSADPTQASTTPPAGALQASLPVLLSGFDSAVFTRVAPLFTTFGLVPMQVAGGGRTDHVLTTQSPDKLPLVEQLVPGSPIAVELIRGDLSIAAYGTVTARDNDEVLAFGHPLFNVGSVSFPIAAAEVVTVLPSVYSSFKISTLGQTLGALTQDRAAGVFGKLGAVAPMIPLKLAIRHGSNPLETFNFEVATHRLLSSVLVEMSLLNSLQAAEKVAGESTVAIRGQIDVKDQPSVVIDHFFSGDQAVATMAGLIAAMVQVLIDNPFAAAEVKGVTLDVEYVEDTRYAQLDRIWTPSRRVYAGDEIAVKAYLQRLRGGEEELAIKLRIPEGTPPGELELVIADASNLAQFEARSERYVPRTLAQLIDLLNHLRKASSLYGLLTRPEAGIAVGGYKHTRLPVSAYTLLLAGNEEETLLPIRRATLSEVEVPSPFLISGFKLIKLEVVGGTP